MKVYLMRHGETAWSLLGKHTGRTDLELTQKGEEEARCLGKSIQGVAFDHVFASPLKRAKESCILAGLGKQMVLDPLLVEWNYGDYEGLTSEEIWSQAPGWTIFTGDPPHGETREEVAMRADQVIGRLHTLQGTTAIFSSGHFLRALAARWLSLPVAHGKHLALSTASLSILGFERQTPAILLWNWKEYILNSL